MIDSFCNKSFIFCKLKILVMKYENGNIFLVYILYLSMGRSNLHVPIYNPMYSHNTVNSVYYTL